VAIGEKSAENWLGYTELPPAVRATDTWLEDDELDAPSTRLRVVTPERESALYTPLSSRSLFGFDFVNDTDVATIVDRILGPQPADGRLPLVVTPNVDYIVRLREPRHADLAVTLPQARYVLPDGQPIVWTSRLKGEPLAARLAGSSMFPVLWKRVIEERRRTVIVAASHDTAKLLRKEHPDAGVVVPPHFDAEDPTELGRVVEMCRGVIQAVRPEFVLVGISFPKQQRVALALLDALRATPELMPVFLLLGGSFEMYLGRVKRAPRWMQRAGLEWFFRFLKEPRRLFRRYFITDARFAWLLVRELVVARVPGRQRGLRLPLRPSARGVAHGSEEGSERDGGASGLGQMVRTARTPFRPPSLL
jgi:N-acetylglucosaminyldiphosphoundecaprenol N-acetyl-beta-D-mannosaminyltransferase